MVRLLDLNANQNSLNAWRENVELTTDLSKQKHRSECAGLRRRCPSCSAAECNGCPTSGASRVCNPVQPRSRKTQGSEPRPKKLAMVNSNNKEPKRRLDSPEMRRLLQPEVSAVDKAEMRRIAEVEFEMQEKARDRETNWSANISALSGWPAVWIGAALVTLCWTLDINIAIIMAVYIYSQCS